MAESTATSTDSVGEQVQEAKEKAQEGAQEAAGKAQDMVREQVDTRTTDLGDRVSSTSSDLRTVGEKLREEDKGSAADVADRVANQADKLGSYLKDSNADLLLSDVEDFGRRQPLVVLAGGIALGIVAARLLKASSTDRYRQSTNGPQRKIGSGTNGVSGIQTPPVSQRPAPTPPATPAAPAPVTPPIIPTTPTTSTGG